jgi:hypothetical protein
MCEVLGLNAWKCLHEDIGSHVIGGTIVQDDVAFFNHKVDEMIMNIDMLCASVKASILSECDGTLVVTEESSGFREQAKDLTNELSKPDSFLRGLACSNILSFHCRQCDQLLLLQTP